MVIFRKLGKKGQTGLARLRARNAPILSRDRERRRRFRAGQIRRNPRLQRFVRGDFSAAAADFQRRRVSKIRNPAFREQVGGTLGSTIGQQLRRGGAGQRNVDVKGFNVIDPQTGENIFIETGRNISQDLSGLTDQERFGVQGQNIASFEGDQPRDRNFLSQVGANIKERVRNIGGLSQDKFTQFLKRIGVVPTTELDVALSAIPLGGTATKGVRKGLTLTGSQANFRNQLLDRIRKSGVVAKVDELKQASTEVLVDVADKVEDILRRGRRVDNKVAAQADEAFLARQAGTPPSRRVSRADALEFARTVGKSDVGEAAVRSTTEVVDNILRNSPSPPPPTPPPLGAASTSGVGFTTRSIRKIQEAIVNNPRATVAVGVSGIGAVSTALVTRFIAAQQSFESREGISRLGAEVRALSDEDPVNKAEKAILIAQQRVMEDYAENERIRDDVGFEKVWWLGDTYRDIMEKFKFAPLEAAMRKALDEDQIRRLTTGKTEAEVIQERIARRDAEETRKAEEDRRLFEESNARIQQRRVEAEALIAEIQLGNEVELNKILLQRHQDEMDFLINYQNAQRILRKRQAEEEAKFWLQYYKEKQKIIESTSAFSNLNFGFL